MDFLNLQVGTTIKYISWNNEMAVGVITEVLQDKYQVSTNDRIGKIFVEPNAIIEVIDKNKVFTPIIEPKEEEIIKEEPAIEEAPIVEVEKSKSSFYGLFDLGGSADAKIIENLPNELTIYIPLYDMDGTPVSDEEIKSRVNDVKGFMQSFFGEFVVQNYGSSYIDSDGKLVMKKHIQVSTYPTDYEFLHSKHNLVHQLSMWAVEWKQEVMVLEYEDEMYYIMPFEDMYKKGGELWIQEATKKMKKKGTINSFTNQAKREGLTPIEFAKKVLSMPKGYTLKTRRRAMFVKNTNPELF